MSKRRSENSQVRREEYEAEDDYEVSADSFEKGFQRASEDSIRQRKIVKARVGPLSRPSSAKPVAVATTVTTSSSAAAAGAANPFSGFQGLTAAKANPFAGFSGLTTDKPAASTSGFGTLPKPSAAPAASSTFGSSFGASTTSAASVSGAAKSASSYQEAIEVLNKDFLSFVSEQAKENPSVSWIAAVQEYVKYADEIATKHASTKPVPIDHQVRKTTVAPAAPAFSATSSFSSSFGNSSTNGSTSAASTSGFSFGVTKDDKKGESEPATAPAATSGFSFGAKKDDAKPASTTASGFSFGTAASKPDGEKDSAAKPAAASGFSFGSLGGASATPAPATTGSFSFGSLPSSTAPASTAGGVKPFSFGSAPTNFGASTASAATPAAAANDDDDENVGREEATVILKSDSPDDDCIFDVEKAKIFEFKKDEKRWADKGLHPLKVLVNKDSKKARVLVRNEIGKIVLNSSLYKGMSVKLHETKGKKTGVIVSLQVDDSMTQFLLKVNAAKVDEFMQTLEKAAASS